MDAATASLALKISRSLESRYLAHREDSNGYCEHGTYQRTDYDNICGHCEDGVTMGDPVTRRAAAIAEARSRMAEIDALFDMVEAARKLGVLHAVNVAMIKARIRELQEV